MSDNKQKAFQRRKWEGSNLNVSEDASPTVLLFKTYQAELDAKYDRYERLIKLSRDLTTESKRIIFLLHRVNRFENNEKILNEAKQRLSVLLTTVIKDIGLELNKHQVYLYMRAFSSGLQEFVEAVSFYYYLKNGNIISLKEMHNLDFLKDSSKMSEEPVEKSGLNLSEFLNPMNYILGIADLTGELMRKCINSVSTGDIEEPFKLSLLLKNLYQAFILCSNHSRELKRKLLTLKHSVQKTENACYRLKIRGTETPSYMLADFFSTNDELKDSEADDT